MVASAAGASMSTSGRARSRPTLTLAVANAILGNVKTVDYEAGERATTRVGGILLTDETAPTFCARLPENWRNVLARTSWFAAKHKHGTNDPKACIMLDGMDAYAGTTAGAVSIPCPFGGIPLPVFLPCEIAWHKIPGTDGACIWEDQRGYMIQTDSGFRVFAVRETARLGSYPWSTLFQTYIEYDSQPVVTFGLTPPRRTAYTRYDIQFLASWVGALEAAPSDVLEITPGVTEIYAKETRSVESPWPYAAVSFPTVTHGAPLLEAVWLPVAPLLLAFEALLASSEHGVLAMRSPHDHVFLFAADATAIVTPVPSIRAAPDVEKVIAPPDPDTKIRTRPTAKPKGGGEPRSALPPPAMSAKAS